MATPLLRAAVVRSAKRVAATSATTSRHQRSHSHSAQRALSAPYRATSPTRPLSRHLFAWAKKPTESISQAAAQHANAPSEGSSSLFFPLSQSPHADVRARSQRISSIAPCPVCISQKNPQKQAAVFECPDCGFPTHCSEDHWAGDAEHAKYCDRLREANEDEHDLRSGRRITEFEFNSERFRGFRPAITNFMSSSCSSLGRGSLIRKLGHAVVYTWIPLCG